MVFDPSKIYLEDVKLIATENLWKSMVKKWEIMGKFFYLPPNAKIVKWTKNSNAKSTNLTFESTKSQWQTPSWLVEWLGSPPWLSSLAQWTNKTSKSPHGPLKNARTVCFLTWAIFSYRLASYRRFFLKNRDFFIKNRLKIVPIFWAIFS